MLKAQNLSKTFRDPITYQVLKDISIEIKPGDTVAIMGSSGVGKSTLLHILGTLEQPDSGVLEIDGQPVNHKPAKLRNQYVGFIFQAFFLFDHLTVLENVLMPLKIARKNTLVGSSSYLRAINLIEKVALTDRKNHPVKLLSGGEKQRVCIARALANSPRFIFADEPTGNLDQQTSKQIQNLLLKTVKEEGGALILATHDADFAKKCDKSFQLKEGKLSPLDLTFK